MDKTVFVTLARSLSQSQAVRLLVDSIRSHGGKLRDCPIWVFVTSDEIQNRFFLEMNGLEVISLYVPESVMGYWFAEKVTACAKAEERAQSDVKTLVWLSSDYFVIQPPVQFELGDAYDAALRPVHIQNVGLQLSQPINEYWQKVYEVVGVEDVPLSVESFVDQRRLRAYFNSHAFSINPSLGLLQRWLELFQVLINDAAFQAGPCRGNPQRIFLHQAVLSTLLATSLDEQRIRILPPEYNYPFNLHMEIPEDIRARSLNKLVSIVYEDRPLHPDLVKDIDIEAPLWSWLVEHIEIK